MKRKTFALLSVVVAMIAMFVLSCMEDPAEKIVGTSDSDSSSTIIEIGPEEEGSSIIFKISENVFTYCDVDTVSLVGILGNWHWEDRAKSDPKNDGNGYYVIKKKLAPGIYEFNINGVKNGNICWADTLELRKCKYWLKSRLVIEVFEDGKVSTVSLSEFEDYIESQGSLGEPRGVAYWVDTISVDTVNGWLVLVTDSLKINVGWPATDTVYVTDTIEKVKYVVVTKIVFDTTKSTGTEIVYIPGDTIWLETVEEDTVGQKVIIVRDTVKVLDTSGSKIIYIYQDTGQALNDTIWIIGRDDISDTLFSGDTVYVPKEPKIVYIDTSKAFWDTVRVNDSIVIIIRINDTSLVDTSGTIDTAQVDTIWHDTTSIKVDTGVSYDSVYLSTDFLLMERITEDLKITTYNIIDTILIDDDTTVHWREERSIRTIKTARDTVGLYIVPLIVEDGGNGEYLVTAGLHDGRFPDTVKASNVLMVGDNHIRNSELNWTTGIRSGQAKRQMPHGEYFQFELRLNEGDTLTAVQFKHRTENIWADLTVSPKWASHERGAAWIFTNEEFVPLD